MLAELQKVDFGWLHFQEYAAECEVAGHDAGRAVALDGDEPDAFAAGLLDGGGPGAEHVGA